MTQLQKKLAADKVEMEKKLQLGENELATTVSNLKKLELLCENT